jgi:hypothetical protein
MKKLISTLLLGLLCLNLPAQAQLIWQDEKSDYPTDNPLYRVKDSGTNKMGFVDKKGKLIILCQFDFAFSFKGDSTMVMDNTTRKCGIIDKMGKLVMPYQFDGTFEWNNDRLKYTIREKFRDFIYANEDFGIAQMNLKWGIINRQGKWLVPPQYNEGSYGFFFQNGYAAVNKDGKTGLIKRKGEVILPFMYDYMGLFNNGLINVGFVRNGLKAGFVNLKNEVIIPLIYSDLSNFEDGFAFAAIKVKNEHAQSRKEQINNIMINRPDLNRPDSIYRYGVIDTIGKVIIPFQYNRVLYANDSLFAVQEKVDGKWAFINTQNQITIPFQFDLMINRFYNGVAIVTNMINGASKFFSIDKTGKCVKDCP